MKASLTVLTLAVDDLERSLAFYRDGLGLATQGIIGSEYEHGAVVFFALAGGMHLALFGKKDFAHDCGLPAASEDLPRVSIGHNVASRAEVDAVLAEAEAAGATVVKAAQTTFYGGYAGYFRDPDGHLWEVVWNPHMALP